jgi:hypothetical protein
MSQSTEQSFRSNLSQFRWARGGNDDSQASAAATAPAPGPFARFYNSIGGSYIPLRSGEASNEQEAYFALSHWERYAGSVCWFCERLKDGIPLGSLALAHV